jgi:hypothetical protein
VLSLTLICLGEGAGHLVFFGEEPGGRVGVLLVHEGRVGVVLGG